MRKGYLSAGLPPPTPGRVRRWSHALAIGAAGSVTAAWVAASAAGASVAAVIDVAMGLLPLVLLVVVVGLTLAAPLARLGLRLGFGPAAVAGALGAISGGAIVALLALVTGREVAFPAAMLPPWLLGLALAVEATWAARAAVLGWVSLDEVASARPRGLWMTLAVVGVAAALVAVPRLLTVRSGRPAPPLSFPPVEGRVAVVAVDGLAREDLEAVAVDDGPWAEIAGWGWAPLRGPLPELPAVLWSTVATGVGPRQHGVIVLDEMRLFGSGQGIPMSGPLRRVLLTVWRPLGQARVVARPGLQRTAATVWEMVSRAGVPVTVGGWWGSWPVRRVLGEVVSERAWLSGSTTDDAVTPGLVGLVERAWSRESDAATASDRLALELAASAAETPSPHLVVLWLPGLDLVRRSASAPSALALAARSRPHLDAVGGVVARLRDAGYEVWLVAVPWSGGTAFAASSTSPGGRAPSLELRELAPTWLDQLGLPTILGGAAARRDFTGRSGSAPAAVSYGPPPPPLAAPPRSALEVQREVLRSLGYLQ